MDPSLIFSIANSFVLIGWLLLLVVPNWQYTLKIIVPGVILLLCLVYAFMILPAIASFSPDAFSSLANVKALFQNDGALTAGWVHYLAFDLFVGAWIVEKGKELGVVRWLYSICLPFTFMFGPVGLVMFYVIKGGREIKG